MEILENLLKELNFHELHDHELSFFVGSGISVNSGMPLVSELINTILKTVMDSKKHVDKISNQKIPFEVFMNIFGEYSKELLDIYSGGIPNTNHKLIAKLAREGHVCSIYTTNFDELIELALNNEGLSENIDYKVYRTEKEIENSFKDSELLKIYKIHGCISKINSLRHTIRNVAFRENILIREKILKKMLNETSKLIIMGYSFSDFYDINPIFEQNQNIKKEIIVVNHDLRNDVKIDKSVTKPMLNNNCWDITINTDDFVKVLWKIHLKDKYILDNINHDWKNNIKNWFEKIHFGYKEYISTILFIQQGQIELGNYYCNKGMSKADSEFLKLELYLLKLLIIRSLKKIEKSDRYIKKAKKCIELLNNQDIAAYGSVNIAEFYLLVENYPKFEEEYHNLNVIMDSITNNIIISKYHRLGIQYCIIKGQYAEVLTLCDRLLDFQLKNGLIIDIPVTMHLKFKAYLELNDIVGAQNSLFELKNIPGLTNLTYQPFIELSEINHEIEKIWFKNENFQNNFVFDVFDKHADYLLKKYNKD